MNSKENSRRKKSVRENLNKKRMSSKENKNKRRMNLKENKRKKKINVKESFQKNRSSKKRRKKIMKSLRIMIGVNLSFSNSSKMSTTNKKSNYRKTRLKKWPNSTKAKSHLKLYHRCSKFLQTLKASRTFITRKSMLYSPKKSSNKRTKI